MAETTTISRPAPYLEAAGQSYLDLLTKRTGQAPTAAELQAMSPQIAGQNIFTQNIPIEKKVYYIFIHLYILI